MLIKVCSEEYPQLKAGLHKTDLTLGSGTLSVMICPTRFNTIVNVCASRCCYIFIPASGMVHVLQRHAGSDLCDLVLTHGFQNESLSFLLACRSLFIDIGA